MQPLHRVFFVLTVALALLGASRADARDTKLDEFFDSFAAEWVAQDPDQATSIRYFSGEKQAALERQTTPQTRKWRQARTRLAQRGIAQLAQFDRNAMSETQRLSADLMRWQLTAVVEREQFADYDFPLDQFGGANVFLIDNLSVRHPLVVAQDADNYLARLSQLDTRMGEALAEARRLARKKRIPPRFILERTLTQLRTFVGSPAAQNPLVTSLAQRLPENALSREKRESVIANATRLVEREIYPAWQQTIEFLDSLLPKATDHAGLWRFEGGAEAYANALYRYTSTRLTADQIHEIGLKEVSRIESQMDAILRQLGRTQGSVRERIAQLEIDLRYPEPGSDAARDAILRDIDEMMADALRRSAALFAEMPQAPVTARPYPRFREANAAASYTRAPFDGSRPAVFQIPLRLDYMTKFGLRTLVYHETVPGHHFQIGLEQENRELPRFRQARALGGISALSEGWALYSEQLAAENGWYDGDPEGLLGQLDAALFRARRLVVDTGLHAKGWTRQQAIDYGIEASEIERYVVMPGQACAYMIGRLKLIELRDRARATLGDKFSFQSFHSRVLASGTVPLDLLESIIDRYIEEERAR